MAALTQEKWDEYIQIRKREKMKRNRKSSDIEKPSQKIASLEDKNREQELQTSSLSSTGDSE